MSCRFVMNTIIYEPRPSCWRTMAKPLRTVQLFYDVISPYSWIAFEVIDCCVWREGGWLERLAWGMKGMSHSFISHSLLSFPLPLLSISSIPPSYQVLCRYRHRWNINLDLCPFFLGGVMKGAGEHARPLFVTHPLLSLPLDPPHPSFFSSLPSSLTLLVQLSPPT